MSLWLSPPVGEQVCYGNGLCGVWEHSVSPALYSFPPTQLFISHSLCLEEAAGRLQEWQNVPIRKNHGMKFEPPFQQASWVDKLSHTPATLELRADLASLSDRALSLQTLSQVNLFALKLLLFSIWSQQ